MKRSRLLPAVCVLCLLLTLLCACAAEEEVPEAARPQSVTLWFVRGEFFSKELVTLAEQYNQEGHRATLELRGFNSESELGEAMNSARPDLLLCGHERAFSLYEQGRLKALPFSDDAAPVYTGNFTAASDCVGISFFPLGAEIPMLIANVEADGSAFSYLDSLCAAASDYALREGKAYFTADSFTLLFTSCLTQLDSPFYGDSARDRENDDYCSLYNLLANAAFDRGVVGSEPPVLPQVEQGDIVCAFVSSSTLGGYEGNTLAFYPVPLMKGGQPLCLTRAYGLAVTAPFDENLENVAEFILWLNEPERITPIALRQGLMPAVEGKTDSDALSSAFSAALNGRQLCFPSADSNYFLDDREFEAEFRAALALLG